MEKQYIYIVQSSKETTKCKIGKTNDLERRLKEYNNMTGKSKETGYSYLFTCEVKNTTVMENDLKKIFSTLREEKSKEIYFYNHALFKDYIKYIKSHKLFVKEIFIKTWEKKQIVKIVKKTAPSLEERGLKKIDVLHKAKRMDNDEFYTRYEDVEQELSMYDNSIWKDKTVFCNCDDAVDNDERNTSAFPLYFIKNFNELGLKKLICTHYSGVVDLFNEEHLSKPRGIFVGEEIYYTGGVCIPPSNQGAKGYIFTKDGFSEFKDYPENYNGSFDHPLSLKILKEETDIVCTNPPFSRAIDYWETIIKSGKKFLILSNISIAISTAFIPYFKNNKVWSGYNEADWFLTPKMELTRAAAYWYTNFPIKDRPKYKQLKLVPLKEIPEKYKKYDDSKTLVVDNCYIPNDYKKPFGVSTRPILNGLLEKGYKIAHEKQYDPVVGGKVCFKRVLVQKT